MPSRTRTGSGPIAESIKATTLLGPSRACKGIPDLWVLNCEPARALGYPSPVGEPTTVNLGEITLGELLDRVGSKSPAPGGGAVAASVGALGAALGRMVVAYSEGKASLAPHADLHADSGARLNRARALMLALAAEDAAAYAELNALQKRPENDPERVEREPGAIAGAVGAPRAMLAGCCDLLRLLETLVGRTNAHLRSDLAIAAVLAEAAAAAAAWNVRINLPLIRDERERAEVTAECARAVGDARTRRASIESACEGAW